MIFFAYIVVFGIYLLIATVFLFYIPVRLKEKRQKFIAFLLALAIIVLAPAGWIYYERNYFDRLCEKEAGVKVFETAEGVEGFYLPDSGWGRAVKDYPYRFIEAQKYDGKLYRYSVDLNGQIVEQPIQSASSRYMVSERREEMMAGVQRVEFNIVERSSNKVFAKKVEFNRSNNFLKPWLSVGSCPSPNERHFGEFLISVLKPSRNS